MVPKIVKNQFLRLRSRLYSRSPEFPPNVALSYLFEQGLAESVCVLLLVYMISCFFSSKRAPLAFLIIGLLLLLVLRQGVTV